MQSETNTSRAESIVAWYTLAAATTGAIPVPAASAAIVAENGAMISHIASTMGIPISVGTVLESVGMMGVANMVGRQLFIEGAKLLSWGTGSVWALAGLSALGAGTAGLQTYIIGRLGIEIAKNGGQCLSSLKSAKVIADSKNTYDTFVKDWSSRTISKPT
jgi:uncharacterized protein (DUF697 family)